MHYFAKPYLFDFFCNAPAAHRAGLLRDGEEERACPQARRGGDARVLRMTHHDEITRLHG